MDKVEMALSLSDQAALYRELQEYLLARLPYVPLWYEDNILVTRDDITGYELTSDGNYDGLTTVRRMATQATARH